VGSSMVLQQQGRKETARLTTVDAFCETEGVSPDFIKADIEGAERQMMKGAVETLKRDAPKISICTYHFADDAAVLREIIKAANPAYRISEKWKKMYARV
ncbi:MAG: FkbM family methyltransferase, partial [Methanocorpusculaceae archaeon]|nr:FkbM family methyltransferase [Methanocorpusculaceae archaeon]